MTQKDILNQVQWYQSTEHSCPYFPERNATDIFCKEPSLSSEAYDILQLYGFRRSGSLFYRPDCKSCKDCVSIRVAPTQFKMSKSQRKTWNKNKDLSMTLTTLKHDTEHLTLYNKYQHSIHEGKMAGNENEFLEMFQHRGFLISEIQYRLNQKLIGVSIIDLTHAGMSSVYFYYDPSSGSRSLGTFSILYEIQTCIEKNIPFWYGGYYIKEHPKMDYKKKFKPAEYLVNGTWQQINSN